MATVRISARLPVDFYQRLEDHMTANKLLVSLFIRAPDLGFLKPLDSKARFFGSDPARKIRNTNIN